MNARDRNDAVEAGAIDRIVKTGQSKRESYLPTYDRIGKTLAEALGLVSEEIPQMKPVGKWNNPGDLKKRAAEARAAGRKPAKSPITDKNPQKIKKKKGERP
jgi:hypothetical protein